MMMMMMKQATLIHLGFNSNTKLKEKKNQFTKLKGASCTSYQIEKMNTGVIYEKMIEGCWPFMRPNFRQR